MSEGQPAPDIRVQADVVARETYRHLRLVLVTLSLLILLAIVALALHGTVEDSISSYYGEPVRDVFVGAMVGIAVCLVVYRGFPPFEDYALNIAGFFAIFVAFVPNTFRADLAVLPPDEQSDALFGLRASLVAVVVAAGLLLLAEWRFGRWTVPTLLARPVTRWVLLLAYAIGPGFAVLVILTGFVGDDFVGVHQTAAILFFGSLAMGVATHAWPTRLGGDGPGDPFQKVVFWGMVGGIPLAAVLQFVIRTDYTVLVVEFWEIAMFATFWIREARRTWHAAPAAPGALPA